MVAALWQKSIYALFQKSAKSDKIMTISNPKVFNASIQFSQAAHIKSPAVAQVFRDTALLQRDAFWRELARAVVFDAPFDRVLDWDCPKASWFVGGKLNVSNNCLDRHAALQPEKLAILWEGEPTDGKAQPKETRRITYAQLLEKTWKLAGALKDLGLKKGDRVAIYMPMLPETVAAMHACARLGVIHTVVFGGFSAQALADRIQDCGAKVLITADGTYRKGQWLSLKTLADEALSKGDLCKSIEHVIVFQRDLEQKTPIKSGRDILWHEAVSKQNNFIPPTPCDSEDPLFILYTSGTTGKPKGLFHTQAGYLVWAHWTTRWLFDLKESDLYWCTADCGWITGHTYVAYGPLSNGSSIFMYEGAPLTPNPNRFWDMIERHKVSILYTAPTAIRSFMKYPEEEILKRDLSSLRVLGSVGEPINPEAWEWYWRMVGRESCPVVDTYWQTETGGAMIAPLPGASIMKAGSASMPLPGVEADVVDPETGMPCRPGTRGLLVIRRPWPSMARGIWGDQARFEKTYWKTSPQLDGIYVTSDYAQVDTNGDFWIQGRVDDLLNISGHRLGSAEVESALVAHPKITEAAAVGIPDAVKGQSLVVFVTPNLDTQEAIKSKKLSPESLAAELKIHITKEIGALARPDQVRIVSQLPKTRSGKIMRRLLRELVEKGVVSGDASTLEDGTLEDCLSSGREHSED